MSGLNINNRASLKDYFKRIFYWVPTGCHNSSFSLRGKLGKSMEFICRLKDETNATIREHLDIIREERKSSLSIEEWEDQYNQYLVLKAKRIGYIDRHNRNKRFRKRKLSRVPYLDE